MYCSVGKKGHYLKEDTQKNLGIAWKWEPTEKNSLT